MPKRIIECTATFFYAGYFPAVPGTFASAVAVFLCYILRESATLYTGVFIVLTVLGFVAGGRMEKIVGRKDPRCVVIDEVCGMMISLFLLPFTPSVMWTAFFLFRAFDMFKIYPADRFEMIGGGRGIMLDDIMAGIYTNLTMQIAICLAGII